ncbi:hypothetical protein DES53_105258 [Roseimicrobium gellanilyticum]|uniref:DUF3592 domain-containing protein n=2 Tax=Roseimicrobium gellanilyticum TaxID=748857 RepID=A0A366HLP4_9BACT|nr:hypothetical protein DES53_105258 [Roseimicrobium gellanilyticum]
MFTCGWCNKHYRNWVSQCESCGGPMPPPPGMDIGPEPPAAPRKLPSGFAMRMRVTGNITTIIGLIFSGVACLMTLAMIGAKNWAALIGGSMLLGGLLMVKAGLGSANRILDAFKNGRPVRGKVASVREDPNTTVNGRHPWDIVYTFESGGHQYEGKMQTYETATANRYQGWPPVWVLVVDGDPERNTLYPPVK